MANQKSCSYGHSARKKRTFKIFENLVFLTAFLWKIANSQHTVIFFKIMEKDNSHWKFKVKVTQEEWNYRPSHLLLHFTESYKSHPNQINAGRKSINVRDTTLWKIFYDETLAESSKFLRPLTVKSRKFSLFIKFVKTAFYMAIIF